MAKRSAAVSYFESTDEELDNPVSKNTDKALFDAINQFESAEDLEIEDEEYEPEVPPVPEPTFKGVPTIVRSLKIDQRTIKRKRIVLTRSMCRKPNCTYDAARELGFRAYKNIPVNRREEATNKLNQHIATVHSFNDNHIIFSGDLQTQFFGVDQKGNPITHI